jgi:hypothetical protein
MLLRIIQCVFSQVPHQHVTHFQLPFHIPLQRSLAHYIQTCWAAHCIFHCVRFLVKASGVSNLIDIFVHFQWLELLFVHLQFVLDRLCIIAVSIQGYSTSWCFEGFAKSIKYIHCLALSALYLWMPKPTTSKVD